MSKLIIDLLNGSKIILSKNRNSRPIECKNKESLRIASFPWDWKRDDQRDAILRRLIVFLFVGIEIIEE